MCRAAQWLEYLRTSVQANKPWDVLVREMLTNDGADGKTRPAAKFYLERDAEPNLLTRDISRLFLGTNLQCCQCHDHPRSTTTSSSIITAFSPSSAAARLVVDKNLKLAVMSEKADGEVTFQSVFDPAKVTKSTGPRLPEAAAQGAGRREGQGIRRRSGRRSARRAELQSACPARPDTGSRR